jgi:hypothetical protein
LTMTTVSDGGDVIVFVDVDGCRRW